MKMLMCCFSIAISALAGDYAIREVRVGLGTAEVTREIAVAHPGGQLEVSLGQLPSHVAQAGLRLSDDRPEVIVGAPRLVRLPNDPELVVALEKARQRVRELAREQARLVARQETLRTMRQHLTQVVQWRYGTAPEETGPRTLEPSDMQQLETLQSKIADADREQAELSRDLPALEEELAAARKQADELAKASERPRYEARVTVHAPAPQAVRLWLTYTVSGACWYPRHHLALANDAVVLQQAAQVVQVTGEDWTQATMILEAETKVPDLQAWKEVAKPEDVALLEEALQAAAPLRESLSAARLAVNVETEAVTVRSGGGAVAIALNEVALPTAPIYQVNLATTPPVRRVISGDWPEAQPLLPGIVQLGDERLRVPLTQQGQALRLACEAQGIVDAHRRFEGSADLTSWVLILTNTTDQALRLEVTEPLPPAQQVLNSQPPGQLEKGALTWQVTLQPKASTTLRYTLEPRPASPR